MGERRACPGRIQRSGRLHPALMRSRPSLEEGTIGNPTVREGAVQQNGRTERSGDKATNRRKVGRWFGDARKRVGRRVERPRARRSERLQGSTADTGLEIDLSRLA